jgi:hypothetical protein
MKRIKWSLVVSLLWMYGLPMPLFIRKEKRYSVRLVGGRVIYNRNRAGRTYNSVR